MTQGAITATTDNELSLAEEVARLARHDGAPAQFIETLLEAQCRLGPAAAGAVLLVERDAASVRVLEMFPADPGGGTPAWLTCAIELAGAVLASRVTGTRPLDETAVRGLGLARPHLVLVPLPAAAGRRAVAAYLVDTQDPGTLHRTTERLELTSGLLGLRQLRLQLRAREQVLERLRAGMEVLEAVNEQDRFRAAAMALCNEIAARWRGERTTLGFLDGRYVKAVAISHTERFDRKMRLVQDLESAMEECLDQDIEVMHPRHASATYVSRCAEELSLRHGPVSVISLPLRRGGDAVGILTLERRLDDPPQLDDIETLRLACELVTPRLLELRARDRWIGARAATWLRGLLAALIGPRHTWKKVLAIALLAAVLFLTFGQGEDRIDASFEIAAIEQRVVPAPFEGRLQSVAVEPGDVVRAGETVLATLETAELQMKLAAARAERARHVKEADLAMRDGRTVEVQIAQANVDRVDADMALLEHRIANATILAPISGTVVHGDLKRQVGAPVEMGTLLFEIAQLDDLRAELEVPEDRITDLLSTGGEETPRGRLASVSHPGDYVAFEVEHINPVAEVIDQRNVFRVRVRLAEQRVWMRPGMKGVAKVGVGRRPYGALWTRRLVNWIRMKLWI